MSETTLTPNKAINRGLLSALLPTTFIKDFRVYASELVCSFIQDIEDILPQVHVFLDVLNEITETQFYFEIHSKRLGILKTYDAEPISFNKELLFSENFNLNDSDYKK